MLHLVTISKRSKGEKPIAGAILLPFSSEHILGPFSHMGDFDFLASAFFESSLAKIEAVYAWART
jgi:hypothetical protein